MPFVLLIASGFSTPTLVSNEVVYALEERDIMVKVNLPRWLPRRSIIFVLRAATGALFTRFPLLACPFP